MTKKSFASTIFQIKRHLIVTNTMSETIIDIKFICTQWDSYTAMHGNGPLPHVTISAQELGVYCEESYKINASVLCIREKKWLCAQGLGVLSFSTHENIISAQG